MKTLTESNYVNKRATMRASVREEEREILRSGEYGSFSWEKECSQEFF